MESASVKDLLREQMEVKGLSVKKTADLTGIPEKYITALVEGNDRFLPPAPYVRGYLAKIATVLDIDKSEIWNLYQKETHLHRSGQTDRLPFNRFAIKSINKTWLVAILILLIAALYLGSNIYQILQPPELVIYSPSSDNTRASSNKLTVSGTTDPSSKLTVNNVEVYVSKDGKFEKELLIQTGLNTIEIFAKKFLGKETKIVRQVIYQPIEITESSTTITND